MIFIPSHKGISHSPEEFTEWHHIEAGVQLLLNALVRLATSPDEGRIEEPPSKKSKS